MTKKQLEYRLWSLLSVTNIYKHLNLLPLRCDRIRKHRAGNNPLEDWELDSISKIVGIAAELPLYINDSRGITVSGIAERMPLQLKLHATNAETARLTSTEINFALPLQKKTVAGEDNSVKQQQQRAIATSMVSSFLAQGALQVQKVTALGQEILVQIQEESKGAIASVKATIEKAT